MSSTSERLRQYIPGVLILLIVVVLWVCSSFIMSSMFNKSEGNYDKPFLTTYLCTSTFTLYLLKPAADKCYSSAKTSFGPISWLHSKWESRGEGYEPIIAQEGSSNDNDQNNNELAPLERKETIKLSAMFCVLWFLANWANNAALGLTSVSSATILCSTSGFLTLAFGTLVGIEKFNKIKLFGVIGSLIGVILVTHADDNISSAEPSDDIDRHTPPHPILGDFIALLSAASYCAYALLIKYKVVEESRLNISEFFGFVGLFNTLFLWPLMIILHYLGIETFQLPGTTKLVVQLLINMFITFSSDVLYVIGMLKTGPVTATLALSMTIPLTILGDLYKGTTLGGLQAFFGAVLVISSFAVVGWADRSALKQEEEMAKEFSTVIDQTDNTNNDNIRVNVNQS